MGSGARTLGHYVPGTERLSTTSGGSPASPFPDIGVPQVPGDKTSSLEVAERKGVMVTLFPIPQSGKTRATFGRLKANFHPQRFAYKQTKPPRKDRL